MVGPWVFYLEVLEDVDDMPDNSISVTRYIGLDLNTLGSVTIGVNDGDTVKYLNSVNYAEGDVFSVLDDAGNAYQNTSGFNAIAIIVASAFDAGVATRHIRVYSAPTTNSTAGATLVGEIGQVDNDFFDNNGDRVTLGTVKIQDNHFLVVENVDDSRAGDNRFTVLGNTDGVTSIVVERSA